MAKRNNLESRAHGAGVEMWKGGFKLFVSPANRPCRANVEVVAPIPAPTQTVEWVVLEGMCRSAGAFA